MSTSLSKESIALMIQDFKEQELNGMSWLDRAINSNSDVHDTAWYAPHPERLSFGTEKVIKPSWLNRVFMGMLIVFISMVCIILLIAIVQNRFPLLLFIGFLLLFSWVIYIIIRQNFTDKNYNYVIRIDKDGLTMGDKLFLWKDIAATCIFSKRDGRHSVAYLVVFTNQRDVEKYSLWAFSIVNWKLSAAIEHYKGLYHLSS